MLVAALVLLSLAGLAAGGSLAAVLIREPLGFPMEARIAAAAIIAQAALTAALLVPGFKRWRSQLGLIFVTGELAAAIAGGLAALSGAIYNANPINGDYEFGPMLLGAIMAAHGTLGLVWASGWWRGFADRVRAAG